NVNSKLHSETMNEVSHDLDAVVISLRREYRWVCDPAAISIDVRTLRPRTLIPKVVEVHVLVAEFLQPGIVQGKRLGFHFVRGGKLADETPATPTKNRSTLETVIFCVGGVQGSARQQGDHHSCR